MKVDLYSAHGTKIGTMELPASLFGAPIKHDLMHQALLRQRSNRRSSVANAKSRGDVRGSTAKLYQQKGTGRARRGSVRSPLLRGGGKAFGPKKVANFTKRMPRAMRRAAMRSCLSLQAKGGTIVGLESYPTEIKTKTAVALIDKLPVDRGRKILFVVPERQQGLSLSVRNIPGAKAILASYLNPEDVLGAHLMVFLKGAVERADALFGAGKVGRKEMEEKEEIEEIESTKKARPKRTASKSSTARKPKESSQSSTSQSSTSPSS